MTAGAVEGETDTPLLGRTAAVLRTDHPAAAELAAGLADMGAAVVDLDDLDIPVGDGPAGGSAVDVVVVPVLLGTGEPTDGPAPVDLVDLDVEEWLDACERPLGHIRKALVAARRALRARGGVVVVVGPMAGTVGEAGRVGYGAAGEGARALVRSCARTWGADGVRVHSVVVPTTLLTPSIGDGRAPDDGGGSTAESSHTLWQAALGRPPSLRADVAATVAGLAGPEMAFTTGTSVAVDGGAVLHS